ncbi:MAG: hypothetical protein ABIR79_24020 [Candidatus Binatia bacterium]
MNTLELQEDMKSRSLRISFTDTAIGSVGEAINQIVFDRVQRPQRVIRHPEPDGFRQPTLLHKADLQEPAAATTPPAEAATGNAPPASSTDVERIRQVFEVEGDGFRLEEHRLKADSRLEYARRLTYLFIYAHELAGRRPIPITTVRQMLDACKVLDANTRHELARKMAVEIDGEGVRLKREGRERAIAALDQILDSSVADPGWTPESQSRSPKAGDSRDSKPSGKAGRKKSTVPDDWAAKWEKHPEIVDGHFALKGKTVLEKGILALWAIHKVGGKTASGLFLQRFIALAFSLDEKVRSLEITLQRDNAKEYVMKAEGGYKLTPSGTKRAVELAKASK